VPTRLPGGSLRSGADVAVEKTWRPVGPAAANVVRPPEASSASIRPGTATLSVRVGTPVAEMRKMETDELAELRASTTLPFVQPRPAMISCGKTVFADARFSVVTTRR
jgi:hypothetical protein